MPTGNFLSFVSTIIPNLWFTSSKIRLFSHTYMFLSSFLCVMLLKGNSYIVIMDSPVRYGVQNPCFFCTILRLFYHHIQPMQTCIIDCKTMPKKSRILNTLPLGGTCSKLIISARFLTSKACYRAYIHQTNYFGRFYPILRLLRLFFQHFASFCVR